MQENSRNLHMVSEKSWESLGEKKGKDEMKFIKWSPKRERGGGGWRAIVEKNC